MIQQEVLLEHLIKTGCYLKNGHFKLVSGKHSDSYIQVRIAMMDDMTRKDFGIALAERLFRLNPTALASFTMGGILLADEAAKQLNIPLLIGIGRRAGMPPKWVNFDQIGKENSKRVVFVDDILTTGGTITDGIQSLNRNSAKTVGIAVAVDRREVKGNITVEKKKYNLLSLLELNLNKWDPSECPLCHSNKDILNLHNPEEDFLSVALSMPIGMADKIFEGYKRVYDLQKDTELVSMVDQWKPWISHMMLGLPQLPRSRVMENNRVLNFLRIVHGSEPEPLKKWVLTELVGHLLVVSNIRVETRLIGCSILVGNPGGLLSALQTDLPIRAPVNIGSSNLKELIAYYDAIQETEGVFLFNNKNGELLGIKHLLGTKQYPRGIQLLVEITKLGATGLVVRRGHKAMYLYRNGLLEAIAVLPEKTGLWEYTQPIKKIEEITNILPYSRRILEYVFEVCWEMVIRGYGGIFIIGDVAVTLNDHEQRIEINKQQLFLLDRETIAEIAKLDGAIFISKTGELQKAAVIILNKGEAECEVGKPKTGALSGTTGARRRTAYLTSKECPNAVVVCVSQNGTITLFQNGESWPLLE